MIQEIEDNFVKTASAFIKEAYEILGNQDANLESLPDEIILSMYHALNRELLEKVMCHRHKPIEPEILSKLYSMKNLSKPIKIVLASFLKP